MSNLTLIENKVQGQSPSGTVPSLSWKDYPSVQRLLDIISSILSDEYIMIAKQNPDVFAEIASGKIGTAWAQVASATPSFGIIYRKKGVAYGPVSQIKY